MKKKNLLCITNNTYISTNLSIREITKCKLMIQIMKNKTFILIIFLCFLPLFCKGQFCKLYSTHGDISSSMISHIYQDAKGYSCSKKIFIRVKRFMYFRKYSLNSGYSCSKKIFIRVKRIMYFRKYSCSTSKILFKFTFKFQSTTMSKVKKQSEFKPRSLQVVEDLTSM